MKNYLLPILFLLTGMLLNNFNATAQSCTSCGAITGLPSTAYGCESYTLNWGYDTTGGYTFLQYNWSPITGVTDSTGARNMPKHIATDDAAADPRQAYTLYPNPNVGNFTLMQQLPDNELIRAELFDALGNRVKLLEITFSSYWQPVSLKGLPSGLYLLHITNSKLRTFNLKFIVE